MRLSLSLFLLSFACFVPRAVADHSRAVCIQCHEGAQSLTALFGPWELRILLAAALAIALWLAKRWTIWGQGRSTPISWNLFSMAWRIVGQLKIIRRPRIGFFHLLAFWGCTIPLSMVLVGLAGFKPPALSLFSEILAIGLLASTLFFLVRRPPILPRPGRLGRLPLLILLAIIISGFLAKGVRLNLTAPSQSYLLTISQLIASPIPPTAELFHLLAQLHILALGLFMALLPFSLLRHLILAPLALLFKKQGAMGTLQPPTANAATGAQTISDLSNQEIISADACLACGRCQEHCPTSISGRPLSPARIMAAIRQQAEDQNLSPLEQLISKEEIWSCTTCMACKEQCPIELDPLKMIISLRRHQIMGKGETPGSAGTMLRNLEIFGDVQGRGQAWRGEWGFDLDLPTQVEPETDLLLWAGCFGSFDLNSRSTIRAMVRILRAAGINFTVATGEELCCGDPARRMGDEGLFQDLAQRNIHWLKQQGIRKIVTCCPHCFNSLKNEYSELGLTLEIIHASQLIADLLRQGKINLKYPIIEKITLHDPCYLSRANPANAPLRQVIEAIPGLETVEMAKHGRDSLCCGGGGGRLWLHDTTGSPMNQVRAKEAAATGAHIVATACPYCKTMLTEGIDSLDQNRSIQVKDIIELVAECTQTEEHPNDLSHLRC